MKKVVLLLVLLAVMAMPAFAAKQVVVLTQSSNGTEISITAAFWYPITSGKLAQTSGSKWAGAAAGENTAIQNGDVIEEIRTFTFPIGTASTTIKDYMLRTWTNRNAQIGGVGPNVYAGIYYDSVSGWSQ